MGDSKLTLVVEFRPSAELLELLGRMLGQRAVGAPSKSQTEPGLTPDDLTARRAAQVPGVLDYLTRKEAAAYTRRGLPAFDRELKPRLTNRGTAAKHVYSREEIDACLRNETASPGRCDDSAEAAISSSGSRTTASVSRNPRARTILKKLRGGRL